jgi:hypothetical protein
VSSVAIFVAGIVVAGDEIEAAPVVYEPVPVMAQWTVCRRGLGREGGRIALSVVPGYAVGCLRSGQDLN